MTFKYPAVFQKNDDGKYTAYFPDLAMCTAKGDTLDDCINDAIAESRDWIQTELLETLICLPCPIMMTFRWGRMSTSGPSASSSACTRDGTSKGWGNIVLCSDVQKADRAPLTAAAVHPEPCFFCPD